MQFLLSVHSLYIEEKLRTLCIIQKDLGLVCGHCVGEVELQRGHGGKPKREVLKEEAGLGGALLRGQGKLSCSPLL